MPLHTTTGRVIRDRDYLRDRHGVIFKVIGDVHPDGHYLGYVKYHPDPLGDRRLFDRPYRQNTVVSKSFGLLADRSECYVYSPVLGCVITGLPRHDVVEHYSCRTTLRRLITDPTGLDTTLAGADLIRILRWIEQREAADHFGITGSFLTGCYNSRSDIDLVCYGPAGYDLAQQLFADRNFIHPYEGDQLMQLYLRRAKYMQGSDFQNLMRQEGRKLQGRTSHAGAHINCEPLRTDTDHTFDLMRAKEIGEMTALAIITDHEHGLATPSLYRIDTQLVLSATIDDADQLAARVTYLRSYLGAYTGAFRTGDIVHISGKLVHLQDGDRQGFGIELTPWNVSSSYLANLTGHMAPHETTSKLDPVLRAG